MNTDDMVTLGGLTVRYLVDGSAEKRHGLFELTVAPAAHVPPPHSHTSNDEIVYVVEGMLRYTVDGETRDLRVGEWMTSPRGSVHGFSNPFDARTRALISLSPDIGKQYFVDVADTLSNGPPDYEKLKGVMMRYGLTLAAPAP